MRVLDLSISFKDVIETLLKMASEYFMDKKGILLVFRDSGIFLQVWMKLLGFRVYLCITDMTTLEDSF